MLSSFPLLVVDAGVEKEPFEVVAARAKLFLEADHRRLGVWSRRVFLIDGHNLFSYRTKGSGGSVNGWCILGAEIRVRHKYADWNERDYVLSISVPHVYNLTIAFDSVYEQAKFLKCLSCSGSTVMGTEAIMLISKLQDFQRSTVRVEKKMSEEDDSRPKSSNLVPKLSMRMVNINFKFGTEESSNEKILISRKTSSESNLNRAVTWTRPSPFTSESSLGSSYSIPDYSDECSNADLNESGYSHSSDEHLICKEKSPLHIKRSVSEEYMLPCKEDIINDRTNNNFQTCTTENSKNIDSSIFLKCPKQTPKEKQAINTKYPYDSYEHNEFTMENDEETVNEPEFRSTGKALQRKNATRVNSARKSSGIKVKEKIPLHRLFQAQKPVNCKSPTYVNEDDDGSCKSSFKSLLSSSWSSDSSFFGTKKTEHTNVDVETSNNGIKTPERRLSIPERYLRDLNIFKKTLPGTSLDRKEGQNNLNSLQKRKIGVFDLSRKPNAVIMDANNVITRNHVTQHVNKYEKLDKPIPILGRNTSIRHENIDRFERFISKCKNSVQSSNRNTRPQSVCDLRNIFESIASDCSAVVLSDKFQKRSY